MATKVTKKPPAVVWAEKIETRMDSLNDDIQEVADIYVQFVNEAKKQLDEVEALIRDSVTGTEQINERINAINRRITDDYLGRQERLVRLEQHAVSHTEAILWGLALSAGTALATFWAVQVLR